MTRLEILKQSLINKNNKFDLRLQAHFDTVKLANGQPLNDKNNGQQTLSRWDKQNDSLRNLDASIKRTAEAIEREERKLAYVSMFAVPECLTGFIADGKVTQWKRHPDFYFVTGVEKARIHVLEDGKIAHRYLSQIPTQDQYAIFRDVFNNVNRMQKELAA